MEMESRDMQMFYIREKYFNAVVTEFRETNQEGSHSL